MKTILRILKKRRKQKCGKGDKKTKIKRTIDGISFTILFTGTITNIEAEVDNIVKVVQEELKNVDNGTGSRIARRVVEKSVNPEICTAQVDGGDNGTEWLIELSNNPLEFID